MCVGAEQEGEGEEGGGDKWEEAWWWGVAGGGGGGGRGSICLGSSLFLPARPERNHGVRFA